MLQLLIARGAFRCHIPTSCQRFCQLRQGRQHPLGEVSQHWHHGPHRCRQNHHHGTHFVLHRTWEEDWRGSWGTGAAVQSFHPKLWWIQKDFQHCRNMRECSVDCCSIIMGTTFAAFLRDKWWNDMTCLSAVGLMQGLLLHLWETGCWHGHCSCLTGESYRSLIQL